MVSERGAQTLAQSERYVNVMSTQDERFFRVCFVGYPGINKLHVCIFINLNIVLSE